MLLKKIKNKKTHPGVQKKGGSGRGIEGQANIVELETEEDRKIRACQQRRWPVKKHFLTGAFEVKSTSSIKSTTFSLVGRSHCY